MAKNTHRFYFRTFSDKVVAGACKLRGIPLSDGSAIVWRVIPEISGGGRLYRYQKIRSALGSWFGRWEVIITHN